MACFDITALKLNCLTSWTHIVEMTNLLALCNFSEFWMNKFDTQNDQLDSYIHNPFTPNVGPKLGNWIKKGRSGHTMGPRGHANIWVLVKTLPSLGHAAFSLSGHFSWSQTKPCWTSAKLPNSLEEPWLSNYSRRSGASSYIWGTTPHNLIKTGIASFTKYALLACIYFQATTFKTQQIRINSIKS